MSMFDPNLIYVSAEIHLLLAVAVFLAGWLPVYMFINFLMGMVTSFFTQAGSNNIFRK